MKKNAFLSMACMLGAVLLHTACSKSDSPTAPRPSPTPQAVSVSLSVSSSTAYVSQVIEARATVRQGNNPVADGTPVRFILSQGTFVGGTNPGGGSVQEATVTTTGGVAGVVFTLNAPGVVQISATVGSASDTKVVEFREAPPPTPTPEPPQPAGTPVVYGVVPNQGSWQGGEEVEIRGENLCVYVVVQTGLCTADAPTVTFTLGAPVDATYPAEVVYVSPDGRLLRLKTPRASVTPLTEDVYADITVTNQSGSATATRVFVYPSSGQPAVTPVLYTLSPNSGPIEGGTRVTIFGSGFQYPVQVLFGDREAQVVSSNFNQIVCIAPSIAPSQPGSPTVVQVQVKNILTGKVSSNTLAYRYGEAMFVSGITPNTGYILGWTPATIYGQGFVAPVQVLVDQGGIEVEAEVLSVSGTSLQVKIPPYRGTIGTECAPVTATIKVTNLGSNLSVTGPTFTYLCSGGISGT